MLSANEISGLVLKAARGAGMPLGCAEELSRAAPHLAQAGELDCLSALLKAPFNAPDLDGGVLKGGHPVLAATAMLDLEAAGRSVQTVPAFPQALENAMRSARSGKSIAGPFEMGETLQSELSALAAKTFVPETEASRLAGAGAGLTDND